MNKKSLKLAVSLIVLLLIASLTTFSFCVDPSLVDDGTINVTSGAGQEVQQTANRIIGIFQFVGTAAAVIILVFIGIKYMSAAPSEKADIKKSAVIYIIGAVLLFAAPNVVAIIFNLSQNVK